ncbi:MAG TPA: isoprenylcysteine carboxylmethyltransferase family protein [Candidatus Sulfotelmatobacter sp.]|nr:isoprenylcysteine carboxylmethyltransferase family protein [Candidatus Sulfotelmatobacter sp.]
MFWRLIKTAIFTVVVPGTVAIYMPQTLRGRVATVHASRAVSSGASLALFFCGAIIYLWCACDFAVKGLGTPAPIDAPRVLVVKGLYRFTRNPMYVGVAAMIAGQAGYYRSASIGIYLLIVLLAFHTFVRLYEEPALRRLFGEQYEVYCRTVPRWLPRLPHA